MALAAKEEKGEDGEGDKEEQEEEMENERAEDDGGAAGESGEDGGDERVGEENQHSREDVGSNENPSEQIDDEQDTIAAEE